jgi:predicted transglutaminase-like cysteine proteinase
VHKLLYSVLSFALVAMGAPPAEAAGAADPFTPVGRRAAPPRGYVEFCFGNPEECPAAPARERGMPAASLYWKQVFSAVEPAAISAPEAGSNTRADLINAAESRDGARRPRLDLSPKLWLDLKTANEAVNSAALPISDQDLYGTSDHWSLPLRQGKRLLGDCEDFVLEKRRLLSARGYPANTLSVALVRTSWGQNHAVLLVSTDQGDLVLDSLSDKVSLWSQAHYTLLLRQSPLGDDIWVSSTP